MERWTGKRKDPVELAHRSSYPLGPWDSTIKKCWFHEFDGATSLGIFIYIYIYYNVLWYVYLYIHIMGLAVKKYQVVPPTWLSRFIARPTGKWTCGRYIEPGRRIHKPTHITGLHDLVQRFRLGDMSYAGERITVLEFVQRYLHLGYWF